MCVCRCAFNVIYILCIRLTYFIAFSKIWHIIQYINCDLPSLKVTYIAQNMYGGKCYKITNCYL